MERQRVQSGQVGFEGPVGCPRGDDWLKGGCVSLDCREEIWETPALMQIGAVEVGEMP